MRFAASGRIVADTDRAYANGCSGRPLSERRVIEEQKAAGQDESVPQMHGVCANTSPNRDLLAGQDWSIGSRLPRRAWPSFCA